MGEGGGEPVDGVERVGDVLAVVVEVGDQGVDAPEHGADLGFPAAERRVEFPGDGAELVDAAAVEQQGQRAEHLLHLGAAAGAGQRDDVPVGEPAGAAAGRGGELHVLLAQEAGLSQARGGVGGQPHVAVDLHGDAGRPVVAEFDAADPADGDVVDAYRGVRDEAEDVVEFGGDGVGAVAEVGTAGQRQVLHALEALGQDGDTADREGEAETEGDQPAHGQARHPAGGERAASERRGGPFAGGCAASHLSPFRSVAGASPLTAAPVAGSGSRGPPMLISLRFVRPSRVRVSGL